MALEKVKEYFRKYGLEERIVELNESLATVTEAAKALHTEEERIAKTLSFLVQEKPILIVFAGDTKVDNHKFKEFFHEKAKMISPMEVESFIGHAPGGVCPFAIFDTVRVYLDESLKRFKTVFPSCGSTNSAIELTLHELESYAQNVVCYIDVGKKIE